MIDELFDLLMFGNASGIYLLFLTKYKPVFDYSSALARQ